MASKKKITTKDVAKYANVSQSAVSMILNQKSNVSVSYTHLSGFYLIALKLAELSGKFTEAELSEYCKKFEEAIATVPEVLKMDSYIKDIAEKIKDTFSARCV